MQQQQQLRHSLFGHAAQHTAVGGAGAGAGASSGGSVGFFPPQPQSASPQPSASASPHFAAAFQHAPLMQPSQHQPQQLFQHQPQQRFQQQPAMQPTQPSQPQTFLPFASSAAFAQPSTATPAATTNKRSGHFRRPQHGAGAAASHFAAAAPSAAASSPASAHSPSVNAGKSKARSKRTRDDDFESAEAPDDSSDHTDPRSHGGSFVPFPPAAVPDVLPPPNKRRHQNSDDTTLPIDSRRSSAELLSDDKAAAALSQSSAKDSGMDDLLSTVSEDEGVAAASPLSDVDSGDVIDISTPSAAARSSSSSVAASSSSAGRLVPGDESPTTAILRRLSAGEEVEVDPEQWLQVNETFQPLLEKMCSDQAKRAAGFEVPVATRQAATESIFRDLSAQQRRGGNVGRAVWDRFQTDPLHNSAFAHAAASSHIPPQQSMVLYKPSRPQPAAPNVRESSCKIECVDDDTPSSPSSPSCICVETPASRASTRAAAAAAASASSSSSSSSTPSSLPFSSVFPSPKIVRIGDDVAHAGWKRRRASEDAELPLYSSTVHIEDMDDFEAQENKKARRRGAGSATPTTPAVASSASSSAAASSSSASVASPQTGTMSPATPTHDSAMMLSESSSLPPSPSPINVGAMQMQMQQPERLSLPPLVQSQPLPPASLSGVHVPLQQQPRPLVHTAAPFSSCLSSSSSSAGSSSSARHPLWNFSSSSAPSHPLLQPHTWQPQTLPTQQQQQQQQLHPSHLPVHHQPQNQPHPHHPYLPMQGFAAAMANAHRPIQANMQPQQTQQPQPHQQQQQQPACQWQSLHPQPPAASGPGGSPMLW